MKNYLLILALIFTAILAGKSLFSIEAPVNQPSALAPLPARVSEGNVTVTATPVTLSPGQPAKIQIRFDTHSWDPKYSLKDQASLSDNAGQSYSFVSWDGNSEGHHVLGNITFQNLSANTSAVTLTIKAVDGSDRTFTWILK